MHCAVLPFSELEVDRHDARVAVRRVAGFDVVRQPVLLAHHDVEQRVGARAAEDVNQQCQRQPLFLADAVGAVADDAVRLVRVLHDRLFEGRAGCRGYPAETACRSRLPGEITCRDGFGGFGREVPDRREYHLVGGVRAAREGAYRLPRRSVRAHSCAPGCCAPAPTLRRACPRTYRRSGRQANPCRCLSRPRSPPFRVPVPARGRSSGRLRRRSVRPPWGSRRAALWRVWSCPPWW